MTGIGRPSESSETARNRSVSAGKPVRARTLFQYARSVSGSDASLACTRAATSAGPSATSKCRPAPRHVAIAPASVAESGRPGAESSMGRITVMASSASGTHTAFTSNANRPPA